MANGGNRRAPQPGTERAPATTAGRVNGSGEHPRGLPHDQDAERAVLGACLTGRLDVVAQVRGILPAADPFYLPRHATLWRCICALADDGVPPDPITVPARAVQRGERWAEPGDRVYVHDLYDAAPIAGNHAAHARAVAQQAELRAAVEAGTRLVQLGQLGDLDALRTHAPRVRDDLGRLIDGTPVGSLDALVLEAAERLRVRRDAEALLRGEQAPPMPELVRLDDLLARPIEPVQYRIDRIWPVGGRVMLAAQAKTGKTTFRDNVLRALADGGQFLDSFNVEPPAGTIAVIDTEMPPATAQRWLREQGIVDPARIYATCIRGGIGAFDILDDERRREWANKLRAHNVTVLIVDCVGPILAVFGLDESKSIDVGRWLAAFEQLLDEAGIGEALVVHHMGHGGERSRGASRLRDWPDVEWRLLRGSDGDGGDDKDPTRYFAAAGRDVDEPEAALKYDPLDRHLLLAGGSRARARIDRDVPAVVEWVRQHPDSSATEIDGAADEMDISRARCRNARQAGVRRGDLCKHTAAKRRENYRVKAECAECAAVRHSEPAHSQAGLWG